MSAKTKLFGVQRVPPGRDEPEVESMLIEALSPAAAAEAALGRQLVAAGSAQNLRALVWHMQSDYNPVCTHLYDPETGHAAISSPGHHSKMKLEEFRIHAWVPGLAVTAALMVAGLVTLV